jgi:hypothetical protein
LGNVPHQELIRLRKEGALSELRALFSNGIGAIDSANHDSFREVVAGVVQNIENAVSTHSAEIRRLSRDGKKFFGISVGGWLVTGSISIAAAVTGNVPLAVASTLLGMVGLPSGREVVREGQDLITARKHVKRSPVAVLFNAKTEKG